MLSKKIRHIIEAAVVKAVYYLFAMMPLDMASAIGGRLGRMFGPFIRVNKTAVKNLKLAMPELDDLQIKKITRDMWDNLGRTVAEFPHMSKYTGEKFDEIIEVEGQEHIKNAAKSGKSTIFFSGHIANWEIVPKTFYEKGCPSVLVYRKSNNPYLDRLIVDVRKSYQSDSVPKGTVGARKLIQAIAKGRHIGMLVDQKQNDGIAVPFFGHDAMTAPAIANFALRYDCSLVPLCVARTNGAKFRAKIFPPLVIKKTGDKEQDILNLMKEINLILEGWIRENPGQWLWVHNRWPKGVK